MRWGSRCACRFGDAASVGITAENGAPQTSHLMGKRRHDVEGTEGERCVSSDSAIKQNWLHTNKKMCCFLFLPKVNRETEKFGVVFNI